MPAERLALALERLTSGDWLQFERFAAEFLCTRVSFVENDGIATWRQRA